MLAWAVVVWNLSGKVTRRLPDDLAPGKPALRECRSRTLRPRPVQSGRELSHDQPAARLDHAV